MKKCKACQKEIDVKASKCPYCQSDQRIWPLRHPIWTILLVLFIIGLIGAAGNDKSTPISTNTTSDSGINAGSEEANQEDNKPKEWVTVTELNGTANKQSDTFELNGGKTRLTYTFDGGQFIVGSIYILKDGTSLEENGGFPEVTVSKSGTDSTFLTKKAGKYYLDVSAANSTWTVKVEEER